MYILLFVLWIMFNGRITLEVTVIGLIVCAVLYLFLYKFMNYTPKDDLRAVRCLGKMLKYTWTLICEIVKANLATAKVILSFSEEPEPILVRFRPNVHTDFGKALLANSITLTPGTITVDEKNGEFLVHGLDKEFADEIETSCFVEQISEMEKIDLQKGETNA